MNLILFGYKKSGKTYFGLELARMRKMRFIDTDLLTEELYTARYHQCLSCKEIVKHHGLNLLRELEKQVIFSLTDLHHTVVALGGGIVLDKENLAHLMKIGSLVYLKADKEALKKRILSGEIPSYLDCNDLHASFEKMYHERLPIYESIPAFVIDTHLKTEKQILHILNDYCESVEASHG
jgi:shikimate kinase